MNYLVLMRHGQSQWNLENRFTGFHDIDLSEQGRAEANVPYPFSGWTQNRDFPPFAEQSFHDWWRKNRGGD